MFFLNENSQFWFVKNRGGQTLRGLKIELDRKAESRGPEGQKNRKPDGRTYHQRVEKIENPRAENYHKTE